MRDNYIMVVYILNVLFICLTFRGCVQIVIENIKSDNNRTQGRTAC